jgi:CheY-like chemotaxis protein
MATGSTSGLVMALGSDDGAMRSEAAVALGQIAHREGVALSAATVTALGEAVGREVLRIGVIIDSDEDRGAAVAAALTDAGMVAHHWKTGASGIALLHRVPGVDVIVIAETLDDLTADQVLDEVARDDRTANVPVVMIVADADAASDTWGERCAAFITGAADVSVVKETLADTLNEDRARANDVAARAAATIKALAQASRDLSGAVSGVAAALEGRPDEVTIPAIGALAALGGADHLSNLTDIIGDVERSDAVRISAAGALGDIATRTKLRPAGEALKTLASVLSSDASIEVRQATALGLGRANLDAEQRAKLAERMRINLEG